MKTKITTLAVALTLVGCASSPSSHLTKIQDQLNQANEKNSLLQASVDKSTSDLITLNNLNSQLQSSCSSAGSAACATGSSSIASGYSAGGLYPPQARTGECFAKVLTPAVYKTETREVLKKAAGYRIKVAPATYNYVTEKVLVKEASEVATLVPAKYEWRTESVLVKEAYDQLKTIPVVYENQSEKVMVSAAKSVWKKGRGPIERLNNTTGDIMCLVEVPAVYKTITSKVVRTPARTESVSFPAVYKDVKKRVMVEGPTMLKKAIPATYKTIKVKKVATPASENRIEIPAVYQTVTNRVLVTDKVLEWRSILCETNTSGDVVRNIQRALLAAGHNPGLMDGVIGSDTLSAVRSYQRAKNLAVGQLTIETLKSLGIRY